ncbi:RNA recognition motif domain [Dillenia turbinata]|uniref:RNA recognition motif domain n=1 Tax=Dillenia turbinata TaxID=194707 RepID=A0AAN8UJX2_9MAGN
MAATASAAVGSSISTNTHKCIRSKNYLPSSDTLLRISSTTRMLHVASLSHALSFESFSIGDHISYTWRVPKIVADIAQEEAAAVESAEAEEEAVEEVVEGDETESAVKTKLYFGNLPYNCDSARLAGIIQDYGSPELVEVLYDRDTGRSRGFAFVTMSTIEDCNTVIQNLDGSEFGGRSLRVNFADKPKPREPLFPETKHKLFVGNLSWSVTSESLTQAFQEYGNVVGARVLYDGETGRSRGYGFVCYSTRAELETALESLNGMELEGRAMRVSLAQGRKS